MNEFKQLRVSMAQLNRPGVYNLKTCLKGSRAHKEATEPVHFEDLPMKNGAFLYVKLPGSVGIGDTIGYRDIV